MSDRELICVGLDLQHWDSAKAFLELPLGLNHGEISMDDVYQAIVDKDMQLWGIHNGTLKAVMVTEIVDYLSKRHLRVVLIGGNCMDEWITTAIDCLDKFKLQCEASGIEILGRKGWVKKLAKYGYKEYQTIVYKE